ncbi:MAG: hypothetical protein ABJJ05_11270 [Maribacter litoralis]|uniref:hypothetical protein n=1 Tax=Maribacter litoralis TaxID=2059726 RepID=UPI0032990676
MKSLLIVLFVSISSLTTFAQDESTMNATYEGFVNDAYVFTDGEGERIEFNNVSNQVSAKYDLKGTKFVGKQFSITFTVDFELDEDDEEIQVSTITGLLMPE